MIDDEDDDQSPAPLWWEQKQNISTLVTWGGQLLAARGDARLVCLGQSPAWIVRAAELIERQRGDATRVDYLPFSGRFHQPAGRDGFTRKLEQCPDAEKVVKYREFLAARHLSPGDIIEDFRRNGRQTLLVEYTETRRGLASFLSVLFDWADEQGALAPLLESLRLVTYSHGRVHSVKQEAITVDGYPPLPFEHRCLSDPLMLRLRMNDDAEDRAQRFVPSYPAHKWNEPPAATPERPDVVEAIHESLRAEAERFVAQGKGGKGV